MADLVKLLSPSGTKVTVPADLAAQLKREAGFRSPAGRPPKSEKK